MTRPVQGIYRLGEPESRNARLVGRRVAFLSCCLNSYHVPPGFCLLAPPFEALPDGTLGDFSESLAEAYRRLGEMSDDPDVHVTVRSVVINPTRPVSSWVRRPWAFYNVAGIEAVTEAVVECLGPYVSDRAREYRLARGEDEIVQLAVVVQRFLPTAAHGVVLTGGPGDDPRSTIVVSAGWGIYEGPSASAEDNFVVRRDDLSIRDRLISEKRHMRVPAEGGIRQVEVPGPMRRVQILSDGQVRRMGEVALSIEKEADSAVSVEFGLSDDRLYVTWCEVLEATNGGAQA